MTALLPGRILGMATLWDPATHGRSSGIGFAVPWDQILAALPDLKGGKSVVFANGFMGISWERSGGDVRITAVMPEFPAAKAGMLVGDVVTAIDGVTVKGFRDAVDSVRTHAPGEVASREGHRSGHQTLRSGLEVQIRYCDRAPEERAAYSIYRASSSLLTVARKACNRDRRTLRSSG